MDRGKTVIVIPVYNAYEDLVECLDSLDAHYPRMELVMVDDRSSDSRIRQHFQAYQSLRERKTTLVYREKRGWFTRAANTGLRTAWEAGAEWAWLLNSDVVVGEQALEEIENCWELAERETGQKTGMVGSHGPQPRTHRRWEVAREPGYVTGHCLLFNRQRLEENHISGFPQRDGEVKGFSAGQLVHISSDRALSWMMNRMGLSPVVSYWSAVGHKGGRSWGYDLGAVSQIKMQELGE